MNVRDAECGFSLVVAVVIVLIELYIQWNKITRKCERKYQEVSSSLAIYFHSKLPHSQYTHTHSPTITARTHKKIHDMTGSQELNPKALHEETNTGIRTVAGDLRTEYVFGTPLTIEHY